MTSTLVALVHKCVDKSSYCLELFLGTFPSIPTVLSSPPVLPLCSGQFCFDNSKPSLLPRVQKILDLAWKRSFPLHYYIKTLLHIRDNLQSLSSRMPLLGDAIVGYPTDDWKCGRPSKLFCCMHHLAKERMDGCRQRERCCVVDFNYDIILANIALITSNCKEARPSSEILDTSCAPHAS